MDSPGLMWKPVEGGNIPLGAIGKMEDLNLQDYVGSTAVNFLVNFQLILARVLTSLKKQPIPDHAIPRTN